MSVRSIQCLSITNPSHMGQQELTALANCDLSRALIAVQKGAQGAPKIITVLKSDVTCWQLFLRFFGAGKLAKTHFKLAEVTPYLNALKWAEAATLPSNSVHYQAYLKVCALANKALYSKHDETLFNNVSSATVTKEIEVKQRTSVTFSDGGAPMIEERPRRENFSFKWNPAIQIKHLEVLLKRLPEWNTRSPICIAEQLPNPLGTGEHLRRLVQGLQVPVTEIPVSSDTPVSGELLNRLHIQVEKFPITRAASGPRTSQLELERLFDFERLRGLSAPQVRV